MLSTADFNELLQKSQNGDCRATANLFPLLYQELRQIAHKQLQHAWSMETIQTTALVNEAYLKLAKQPYDYSDQSHFFAICAKAMRQIIINYAEQKNTQKRGGDWQRTSFDKTYDELSSQINRHSSTNLETLLAVDAALDELTRIDKQLCQLVELRFFAGMTETEIAHLFGVTERTIRRNWHKAKILMAQALD